jgi:phosphoglycolate phosphatase-like HAD superfamily hydrolase
MKVACFDIDGTLLHSHGAGRRAIQHAMVEVLGTAGPIDAFRFDGRTDGEIVLRLAEAAGVDTGGDAVARVLERYVLNLKGELASGSHHTLVYPGVHALLDALEARADCVLGLLTGNVVEGARLKLRSAGLDPARFRVGAFGTDHHVRAELPGFAQRRATALLGRPVAGGDVIIIGDTPADMTCGQGIGARAIGVGTAAYRPDELMAVGGHAAFADLSDTAAVVAAIFA